MRARLLSLIFFVLELVRKESKKLFQDLKKSTRTLWYQIENTMRFTNENRLCLRVIFVFKNFNTVFLSFLKRERESFPLGVIASRLRPYYGQKNSEAFRNGERSGTLDGLKRLQNDIQFAFQKRKKRCKICALLKSKNSNLAIRVAEIIYLNV